MAAAPTNQFKTVTHTLTTNAVGIYTCPAGVSALVIYGNVANVGASSSVTAFTASLKHLLHVEKLSFCLMNRKH